MSKYVVTATWDDVPHLTAQDKKELLESYPAYQRDARSKGVPQLGSGAIYPIAEDDITVPDFEIPYFWPRSFALDVGWNKTAAVWGAIDKESNTSYLYSAYYQGEEKPSVHAQGILARGKWIPGVVDPAAGGRSQDDGQAIMTQYQGLGLTLSIANNAVEAGIYETWMRLSSGRLKVFASLKSWFEEYRLYRRDEKGKIVKVRDHLMDCTRYFVMSGIAIAAYMPAKNVRPQSGQAGQAIYDYDPLSEIPGSRAVNQAQTEYDPWR